MPAPTSDSYKRAPCCGADCSRLDWNPDEPCWGTVTVYDVDSPEEDWGWLHMCQGHYEEQYVPETQNP